MCFRVESSGKEARGMEHCINNPARSSIELIRSFSDRTDSLLFHTEDDDDKNVLYHIILLKHVSYIIYIYTNTCYILHTRVRNGRIHEKIETIYYCYYYYLVVVPLCERCARRH